MNAWQCRYAVRTLNHHGVIAYPTDTVYGLGCHPASAQGVGKILDIKQRPWNKGLILLCHELELISPYIQARDAELQRAQATWPGPVTWVFTAQDWVPRYLTGHYETIAVRLTQFSVVKELCRRLRAPLVSTSANISGRPVVVNRYQLLKQFATRVDYIVPGDTGNPRQSSQIRHAQSGQVIR